MTLRSIIDYVLRKMGLSHNDEFLPDGRRTVGASIDNREQRRYRSKADRRYLRSKRSSKRKF